MIKTISISLGLVGLTALSGMALSMAHDLSFATPSRVAPEQVVQVALAQPAPVLEGTTEYATGTTTLEATPGEAQVIPAILESSGPHNRLAGKSIVTASVQAPAESITPAVRQQEFVGGDFDNQTERAPRDAVVTVSAPVFERTPSLTYISAAPVSVPSSPAVAAVSSPTPAVPEPDFLIGVFR